ncbi:MAG: hypothetical protein ACYC56_14380 [Candidatus Aquicultor sp.]
MNLTLMPGENKLLLTISHTNPRYSLSISPAYIYRYVGGVLTQDDVIDGVTNKQYSSTDKTKLFGIEERAVALSTVKADADIASAISLKHSDSLDHSHSNKTVLDATQESFTSTLKSTYDGYATDKEPANSNIQTHISSLSNPHSVTKTQVGLENADNTSDANKPVSTAQQTALDLKANKSITVNGHALDTNVTVTKGDVGLGNADNTSDANKPISSATQTALNAKADLVGGLIISSQLPSYVDDVLEYTNLAAFPITGEAGKIYVALDTNLTYRWSGTTYVEISASLALGETSATAYRGDRGKTAYDHSQLTTGNPHAVTKTDIGLSNVPNLDTTNAVNNQHAHANKALLDTIVQAQLDSIAREDALYNYLFNGVLDENNTILSLDENNFIIQIDEGVK